MVVRSTDRILKLEKVNPKQKDVGLFDARVFTGENNLHALMDTQTGLWSFRYEHGHVPPPLRNRFTDFNSLRRHAEDYFKAKNIRIVEVID